MPASYTKEKIEKTLLEKRRIAPSPDGRYPDCWYWTGNLSDKKYGCGRIFFDFKRRKVYRLSMWLWKGFDLDSTLDICHHCDNPVCFNPDHLFVGTHQDNMTDMKNKGRSRYSISRQRINYDSNELKKDC